MDLELDFLQIIYIILEIVCTAVSCVTSQPQVVHLIPGLEPFCVEFVCSPCGDVLAPGNPCVPD